MCELNHSIENFLLFTSSVKNKNDTLSGGKIPKEIAALENEACNNRNRNGLYLCVLGHPASIGDRSIRYQAQTKEERKNGLKPWGHNTETWGATFLWPFMTTYSYEEMEKKKLEVAHTLDISPALPKDYINAFTETFGDLCKKYNLVEANGIFNDCGRLISFFCETL